MTNKKEHTANKTKDPKEKKIPVKEVSKKKNVNYKKENNKLSDQINLLEKQLESSRVQNQIDILSFQEKAKGFQSKAQEEINKVRDKLEKKAESYQKEFKKFASQKLFESIIGPLTNIEIAINVGKSQGADVSAYVMGFDMLLNQLFSELEVFGLKKIKPKAGDEFSPKLHQAIAVEKGVHNKILKVNKNGFQLHDRVISPAIVIIGK
ncbi:nucleotide exchange factor GrpE [Candidatus Mycoplasma mahonii]|uniref:nucleotide exchange factor GrpE n=1 Tax=Candidatus Mycoplasma mahonii TaxID=3004105 RepID=UPI0026EB7689|nr:nucleotide exchange factor GrpE [Candidatus Mycoplasma mahonii]WKX02675.1 nucleotide exchange factor GrpE [Candidatus Mycoplasma mahonii]